MTQIDLLTLPFDQISHYHCYEKVPGRAETGFCSFQNTVITSASKSYICEIHDIWWNGEEVQVSIYWESSTQIEFLFILSPSLPIGNGLERRIRSRSCFLFPILPSNLGISKSPWLLPGSYHRYRSFVTEHETRNRHRFDVPISHKSRKIYIPLFRFWRTIVFSIRSKAGVHKEDCACVRGRSLPIPAATQA